MKRVAVKEKCLLYKSRVKHRNDIAETIDTFLTNFSEVLPDSPNSTILIKPNLHMDLNSLMGNTTDLRILSDVIRLLQKRGYKKIIVGEGTNCGMHRFNIDVYARLGVKDLVSYYGVRFVDFNRCRGIEVQLSGKTKASVADICLENDCFINLPKIKTHRLASLSVCLKSLVGCFVKMDKRKIHLHLHRQIVKMNEIIQPDLHIVDGLIVKQGQGPAWGEPVRRDTLIAGKNPFFIDAFCAWFTGFDCRDIPYLSLALEKDLLEEAEVEIIKKSVRPVPLIKATPQRFVNLLALPLLDPLRNLVRPLSDIRWVSSLLYRTKIREDFYDNENPSINNLIVDREKCTFCHRCRDICPVNIDITDKSFSVDNTACIKCLYCYLVCPEQCITIKGELGYFSRAAADYREKIDRLGL